MGRQRAPPIAADRDQRHALGRRGIGDPVDMGDGEIIDDADDFILNVAEPLSTERAVAVFLEKPAHLVAGFGHHVLQTRKHGATNLIARPVSVAPGGQRGQFVAQTIGIDQIGEFGLFGGHVFGVPERWISISNRGFTIVSMKASTFSSNGARE